MTLRTKKQSATSLVIPGSSHPTLARVLARHPGLSLARVERKTFRDGERYVRIVTPVRRRNVVIVQSGQSDAQEHFVELLQLVDAARRAGASRITAAIPFFPYRRAERIVRQGEAVSAAIVARTLELLGVNRTVCVDLHEPSTTQFFRHPVVNILPFELYARAIVRLRLPRPVIAGADGSVSQHARSLARLLHASHAAFAKERRDHDRVHSVQLNADLSGKDVILIDDEINTGGTIIACAKQLKRDGARSITAIAAHGVFSGDTRAKLQRSPIRRVFVTDSIPQHTRGFSKLTVLPLSRIIADEFA